MKFRLELRDSNFNVKEILDREFLDLSWAYSRIGGCGEFSFKLPRKRFSERAIIGDFNVRIYYRNPETGVFDLWYQGLIESKVPTVKGNTENIIITGHGYQSQLSRIYLNNITYTSQEVSVIVKDILDNYVTPDTDITYSASDIEVTSFTVSSINFNDDVKSAFQKLADITGSREWGVDKNRKFFFKARSSTIGFRFLSGTNIMDFEDTQDFSKIINRIIFQGAQAGGTYFTAGPYNDTASQAKYGIRSTVIQNSSVVTSDVASQLADAKFDEFGEVTRKASCALVGFGQRGGFDAQMEGTTPLPLFAEISRKTKYGEKEYGTFLYSGIIGRIINRINYFLTNNNSLKIDLDLGQLRTDFAEQISQIEYDLDQQRSAAL